MMRAPVLLVLLGALGCARSEVGPPLTTCSIDTDCARNERCVDGDCILCAAPEPTDPCVTGSCYYIAPSGGSDASAGTNPNEPWETFDHAWTVLQPADTLVLLDGTYTSRLTPTVSGLPGSPITIRAQTDGGAVIDGEYARVPCRVGGVSYLTLEGLRCQNLDAAEVNGAVFMIAQADHITVRRVTLSEATPEAALLHVFRSSDILIEDSAGWGQSSSNVFSTYGADRVTFRRCWAELPTTSIDSVRGFTLYRTSDSRVENCVVTAPGPVSGYEPAGVSASTGDADRADRNWINGNVTVDIPSWSYWFASHGQIMEGTRLRDNVAIRSLAGTFQRTDIDMVIDHHTQVETAYTCVAQGAIDAYTYVPGFGIHGEVTNSICMGADRGFSLSTWAGIAPTLVLFGVTTPFDTDVTASANELVDTVEPAFDTAALGDGGYLVPPDNLATSGSDGRPLGAEVLYRYRDGELTCVPLWPWPMETRIEAERGLSVTWETGGGLWRSLDGVYP